MLELNNVIRKILSSTSLQDVFSKGNIPYNFRKTLGALHPDKCSLAQADEAFSKLLFLKSEYEKSISWEDDAGIYEVEQHSILLKGHEELLKQSYEHFLMLKGRRDTPSQSFMKYLPESMALTQHLKVDFEKTTKPISKWVLPQHHVLWILSRILEVSAWFSQIGYAHCGLTPDAVFVVPKTHGIVIPSFYHLTRLDRPLKTISARYQHWYPKEIFKEKRARPNIDLEMCKRIACFLLGDPSGMGIRLRGEIHPALLEFLIQQHHDAFDCYDEYRKMLNNNFEVKFHPLEV